MPGPGSRRFGVVSIRGQRDHLAALPVDRVWEALGRNTGNLLFTNALYRQLSSDLVHVGFAFNPVKIADEVDGLVVPAANWLNSTEDWGFLADRLAAFDKPVVLIGLGIQSAVGGAPPVLREGTRRLLRVVTERSESISVRGAATAEFLASYGVRSVVVTGCPSLYWHCRPDFKVTSPASADAAGVVMHGTRYEPPTSAKRRDRHRWLYAEAFRTKARLVIQSEMPELPYLLRGLDPTPQQAKALARYFGAKDWAELAGYLGSHARALLDVDAWIADMRDRRLSVGSRLHATIASILAGVSSVLVSHDTRTSEVAEFIGIPRRSLGSIDTSRPIDLEELAGTADMTEFNTRFGAAYAQYAGFLSANGLEHRL